MSKLASSTEKEPKQFGPHGRYQVVQFLNNVGANKTYLATDTHRLDNPRCLVKELRLTDNTPDSLQAVRNLFKREAEIIETLGHHPQFCQLVDYLEIDQTFYLIQDLVPGKFLSEELATGERWSEEEVIHLMQEVLGILSFVHDQGIIYGNLQPEYIIQGREDDRFFLTYISPVKQVQTQIAAVQGYIGTTVVLGTLGYMAMEQVCGEPLPCSDIYSLGMICIQALTGVHPMELEEDATTGEVLWRHLATVSYRLASIINNMVGYHFRNRYQSADEVLAALDDLNNPAQLLESAFPLVATASLLSVPTEISDTPETGDTNSEVEVPEQKGVEALESETPSTSTPAPLKDKNPLLSLQMAGAATSLALAVGVGGYLLLSSSSANPGQNILAEANQNYQQGNFEEAIKLAQSISPESKNYQDAQAAIAQWQEEREKAETQFKKVEAAFAQNEWLEVIEQANQLPNTIFWRRKISLMVNQAQINLEGKFQELLAQAQNQAAAQDFSGALKTFQKIPKGTKAYEQIQAKIEEYTEKRKIRADYLLYKSRQAAMKKDFTEALVYLKQIPKDTPAYADVQSKMAEYQQKQRIKANHLLQMAYNQAIASDFAAALKYLEQIPEDAPIYNQVQQKIAEYKQKQRVKATNTNTAISTTTSVS
ncbi:MAG: serine/threonine-protein kinase [Coleofasciculaceae cyanobacterium]